MVVKQETNPNSQTVSTSLVLSEQVMKPLVGGSNLLQK